jgi:hypothetical protein
MSRGTQMTWNLDQALAYWYGRINYEQQQPRATDLKLDRMRALLHQLGDPQERYGIVHVAGSKGKGSTSAMLASILRRAGCRTGLFTSPHLCRVEERMQVDGVPISADELTANLAEVRRAEVGRHVLRGGDGGRLSALRAAGGRRGGHRSRPGGPFRLDQRLPAAGGADHQHQPRSHQAAWRPAGEHCL